MEYIKLGGCDLKVSRLGFGGCPMGGHGWGKVSIDELRSAISAALDCGVILFDTADIYGLGKSEQLLGNFLKGRRHEAVIATKFGVRFDNNGKTFYDNSPAWIENALEGSLKRLNIDCIDLYQIHYWDGITPLSDIIDVLEKKRIEGKIRYYGFSNIALKDINNHELSEAVISFQSEYSLANRSHEEDIINIHQKKSLGFLSWGSLGQGVLSGKYTVNTKFPCDDRRSKASYVNFHGEKFKNNLEIVKKTERISESIGKTLTQVAIRWILDYISFSVVLVGIKRKKQIIENVGAFGWHLTQRDIDFLSYISS